MLIRRDLQSGFKFLVDQGVKNILEGHIIKEISLVFERDIITALIMHMLNE